MQANQYFDRGDYASSVESYEIALRNDPNNPAILVELGRAKANLGDYSGAVLDFNSAIKLNPNDSGAYIARGTSLERSGQKGLALNDFDKAISLKPFNTAARLKRKTFEFGNKQSHCRLFNRPTRNPNNLVALYERALLRMDWLQSRRYIRLE